MTEIVRLSWTLIEKLVCAISCNRISYLITHSYGIVITLLSTQLTFTASNDSWKFLSVHILRESPYVSIFYVKVLMCAYFTSKSLCEHILRESSSVCIFYVKVLMCAYFTMESGTVSLVLRSLCNTHWLKCDLHGRCDLIGYLLWSRFTSISTYSGRDSVFPNSHVVCVFILFVNWTSDSLQLIRLLFHFQSLDIQCSSLPLNKL